MENYIVSMLDCDNDRNILAAKCEEYINIYKHVLFFKNVFLLILCYNLMLTFLNFLLYNKCISLRI